MPDRRYFERLGRDTGFSLNLLEKAYHLIQILALISRDTYLSQVLTLKGGSALNFVYFDWPRLSIDLDFNFTGAVEREEMLRQRKELASKMEALLGEYRLVRSASSYIMERHHLQYSSVRGLRDRIKVEINFLERVPVRGKVQRELIHVFPSVPVLEVFTYSVEELLAMKAKALMERALSRDLFDLYLLAETEVDLALVRKLLAVYSCFSEGEWGPADVVKRAEQFAARAFAREMNQFLRDRAAHRFVDVQGRVVEFFGGLAYGPAEQAFLEKFKAGVVDFSLLFERYDPALRQHPSLLLRLERM